MGTRRPAVAFIMVASLLDVIGVGLIIPVLPILLGDFTASREAQAYWYAAVAVTYGVFQFLCAPLLGALSDRFGRRPILLLGIAGLGATFLLTALAHSLWVIVASRILGGGLSANVAVAQAYAADVTPVQERTNSLGRLGAMFGVGFIFGPMLGGLLGGIDLRLPFYVAAALCAANWLYGLLILPESLAPSERRPLTPSRINPFAALTGVTRLRGVGSLVIVYAVTALAAWVLQTSWVLYTNFRFGWGPRENGLSLFAAGVVAVVVQGGLLGTLLRWIGEERLILAGLASATIAYTGYALVPQGWMMYPIIVCNFLAQGTIVTMQGIVSKAARPEDQGRVMGSLASIASLMVVVATLIGNSTLAQVSSLPTSDWRIGAPFLLASFLQALALLIARRHFSTRRRSAAAATSIERAGP